jgi:serine/threonine protein kinase
VGLSAFTTLVRRLRGEPACADGELAPAEPEPDARPPDEAPDVEAGQMQPPLCPELFGPFQLVERLGEGGMAEIFAAVRDGEAAPLVIKRLRPHLCHDARAVAHFVEEGQLGSALQHPHIVGVFEHGQVPDLDRHYLTAEYVPGRDVGCLTRKMVAGKQRPLTANAILTIAHDTLAALEYAHERRGPDGNWLRLVHRDITPENLLISRAGEVKLLDFGIAQAGIEGAAGRTGEITGNVDFMSPEQARGRAMDARSDLFSLGLVLYFCAARAPLYRKKALYDRLLLAAGGPGEDELGFVAGLPPPLPELLPLMLAVEPRARVQSARELRRTFAPDLAPGRIELASALERAFGPELAAEQRRLDVACQAAARRRVTEGAARRSTKANRTASTLR